MMITRVEKYGKQCHTILNNSLPYLVITKCHICKREISRDIGKLPLESIRLHGDNVVEVTCKTCMKPTKVHLDFHMKVNVLASKDYYEKPKTLVWREL